MDFQQRVIDEKRELDDKLTRLSLFLATPPVRVPPEEFERLKKQETLMVQYSAVLGERIRAFLS